MTRNRDAMRQLFRVSRNRIRAIDPLKQIFPGSLTSSSSQPINNRAVMSSSIRFLDFE
jgi:hypothetical protein